MTIFNQLPGKSIILRVLLIGDLLPRIDLLKALERRYPWITNILKEGSFKVVLFLGMLDNQAPPTTPRNWPPKPYGRNLVSVSTTLTSWGTPWIIAPVTTISPTAYSIRKLGRNWPWNWRNSFDTKNVQGSKWFQTRRYRVPADWI